MLSIAPALARDNLGAFGGWQAFRDRAGPRCYALAPAEPRRQPVTYEAFADVTSWPRRDVPGEVHFRLSYEVAKDLPIILAIGGQHMALVGNSGDARLPGSSTNAAVIAAMRVKPRMEIVAFDPDHRRFVDTWRLAGAEAALAAAAKGCAKPR